MSNNLAGFYGALPDEVWRGQDFSGLGAADLRDLLFRQYLRALYQGAADVRLPLDAAHAIAHQLGKVRKRRGRQGKSLALRARDAELVRLAKQERRRLTDSGVSTGDADDEAAVMLSRWHGGWTVETARRQLQSKQK